MGLDCMQHAHGMIQGRTFANLLNLRVLKKAKDFLTSRCECQLLLCEVTDELSPYRTVALI